MAVRAAVDARSRVDGAGGGCQTLLAVSACARETTETRLSCSALA